MSGFITDYFVVIFLIGWGLLIIISFLGAFIRAVLSCIRDLIYGEERTAWTESEREPGELYRAMSRDRKDEIDNLRKIALLKYLSRFTLVRPNIYVSIWLRYPFAAPENNSHDYMSLSQ
jgi:hypothetical protein